MEEREKLRGKDRKKEREEYKDIERVAIYE